MFIESLLLRGRFKSAGEILVRFSHGLTALNKKSYRRVLKGSELMVLPCRS